MADNRRDVEFIIRARDLGSRTFREVSGAVQELTTSLDQQVAAAERGEVSANELRNAYRQLNEAGRALISQQGLIDYYRRVADNLGLAETKANDARAAQQAYAQSLEGVENRTKKQEAELAKLTRAADAAEKKTASLRGTLETQSEKLQRAGIDTENLAASQQQLVQVANQVGDALTKTQGALDGYDANLRRVKQAQQDMADARSLDAFRQIGVTAEANARSLGQGADAFEALGSKSDSVASRLRKIVDPTRAAGENLNTLVDEVNRLDAVVGTADQPIREYQDAIYDLGQAQRSILSQAQAIDSFRQQEAAVEAASRAVDKARSDVLQYATAVSTADEPNRELVRSLRQAEAALASENRELENQTRRLASLSANLKAAGIDTKNLAAAESQLEAASNTSANALRRLDDAAAGKNSRAGRFLGLRPYELTNLSYQINDIFTQIASGTSVTQTLAQQGGQIVQIFPRAFGAMVAFIPELAALAAVIVSVGAAMKNIADEDASTRQFAGSLALTADESRYSAEALAATAHELDVFGGSLEDARKEIGIFLQAGLDPAIIERFGKSAQNVADVTGKDLPEAAKLLADGFSGGYEQVVKLDDALNFLTAAEREQIKVMFDSGDAAGARTRAFEIFEQKADEAADKARGAWGEAFKALTDIWDDLLEAIGDSKPMQDAISWLDRLGDAVERWADRRKNAMSGPTAGEPTWQLFSNEDIANGNVSPLALQILGNPSWRAPRWAGGQNGNQAGGGSGFQNGAQAEAYIRDLLRQSGYGVNFTSGYRTPEQQRRLNPGAPNSYHTRNPAAGGAARDFTLTLPGGRAPTQADYDRVEEILKATGRFAEIITEVHGTGPHAHVGYGINAASTAGTDPLDEQSQRAQKAGDAALDKLREEIELRDKTNHALRLEVAGRNARRRIQEAGGTAAQEDEAAALAVAEEQRKINEEVKKESEQQARRTEAEQRRLAAATDTLRSDLRGLEARAQRAQDASLDARLQAIDTQFSGIEQNLKEAEAAGVTSVDGQTLAQYRERVSAGKEILKQQETMAFYEDQIKSLEEQRANRLRQIADDAAAGVINADEAFRQALAVNDELAPKIAEMAANAWEFGQGIRTATPNPQLEAFITEMSRANAREVRPGAVNSPAAGVGREQLTAGQAELNALIQQRNELVANYTRLVELGTMTQEQARDKTAEAYRTTQPLIEAQVGELIRLIDAMRAAGTITEAEFARIRTSLEVTSQEALYVDANFLRLKNTITEGLANGAITALNGISEALAGLADGSMDAGEALDAIWDAARTGLADFLQGIANVLMQMAVMQAMEGLPFLDGLTGGLMDVAGLTAASTTLSAASATLTAAGTTVSTGAAAVTGASTVLGASAAALTTAGGAAAAAAVPLTAAAAALAAAAAAMTTAATLQLAANATGGILHSGGIVGSSSSGVSRSVSSLAWVGAPRHHSGAVVGLASDERAAILQTGEEVLAKNDPRNILNGGAAAGGSAPMVAPPTMLKIMNLIDSGQFVSEGMESKDGEQAVMNFMTRRKRQINAILRS